MSRASGASFAQFFPSAPRAAKDKAKEREKVKSMSVGSPSIPPVADSQGGPSDIGHAGHIRSVAEGISAPPDSTPISAEDIEFIPGDILNGVGSASSHTSTISSVFSVPPQQSNLSTFGGRNVNSLTPLTTTDSSPNRIASPHQYKSSTQATNASGFEANKSLLHNDALQGLHTLVDQQASLPRIHMRDPAKGIKGTQCTYDPLLDRKLSSNDKKKAKPIYKEFGLVRIHNLLGSVIFL